MADREAKLRLILELVQAGKTQEALALINKELERGGQAAGTTAAQLDKAAAATDRLDTVQESAAGSAREEASALEDVSDAATESGQKATQAGAETVRALDSATTAAEGERAALAALGDQGGQSGAEAAAGVDKVTEAEREATTEAERLRIRLREAGDTGELSAADLAAGFTLAGDTIRKSGQSLEVQRTGLQALVGEAEKAKNAFIEQGAEGAEGANATGDALIRLKANLADVNAEIGREIDKFRAAGAAGNAAFDEISGSALTFESVAAGATAKVNAAWQTLNSEFRITPRQLGQTGQAVELLKIELLEMASRGIAATTEQIAVVERLESEYLQLTATANRLTNAVKDNAVRLKEQGHQVQGVAAGFQQLASLLGPTGARLGLLVGNLGQAAGAAENMKDAVNAMDLNKLGGSASKLGVQLAAVIAALGAGAYAGAQFSKQNAENSQAVSRFTEDVKKLIGVPVADWIDGANLSLQRWFADPSLDGLLSWMSGYALVTNEAGSATRFMIAAQRDGLDAMKAQAIATELSSKAWKFYELAQRGGAEGHELWMRAIRESAGDADALNKFIDENNAKLQRAARLTDMSTEARKREIEATRDLRQALDELDYLLPNAAGNADALHELADRIDKAADNTRNLTAAERERIATITETIRKGNDLTEVEKRKAQALLDSARAGREAGLSMKALADAQAEYNRVQAQGRDLISQNAVAVGQAISDMQKFEVANNGTTASINRLLVEIERYIALGPTYAAETNTLGAALAAVLENTTRLTPEQRANIEAVAELATKTGELTAQEKAYAEELIKVIETGDKRRVMLKEQTEAASDLARTLAEIDAQEARSNAEREAHANTLRTEIELLREAREEIERRTGATEKQTAVNKYQGASLDYLRMQEQKLQEELEATLSSWSASSDAKRRDAEEGQRIVDNYREQTSAISQVKASTTELHAVLENGKVVWTNVAESANKAAGATLHVKTTAESLGTALDGFREHQTNMSASMSQLVGDAEAVERAMDAAAASIRRLNEEAAKAAGSGASGTGIATPDMQVNP